MLKHALAQQPNLASAHTCMGFDSYLQRNNDEAEKEFQQSATANPQDFRPFYYLASIALRSAPHDSETISQTVENLEKVVRLNLNFAPAWALLSFAYRLQPDTREKALDAAHKANHLDPAVMAYRTDVFAALLALDRAAEARAAGEIIVRSAHTPEEKALAQNVSRLLAQYEE